MKRIIQRLGIDRLYQGFYNWITQLRAQAIALIVLLLLLMTALTVGVAFLAHGNRGALLPD